MDITRFISDRKYSRVPCLDPPKGYETYYQAERMEIVIHKGESICIPADWFHFVFSEETGGKHDINLAISFWSERTKTCNEDVLPVKMTHDIEIDLDHFLDDEGQVTESSSNLFLSNHVMSTRFFNEIETKIYKQKFGEFLKARNPNTYIQQAIIKDPIPLPPSPWKGRHTEMDFWINFGRVYSQLHCDNADNVLCQIEGSKRVILFSPKEADKLYLYNHYSKGFIEAVERSLDSYHIDEEFIHVGKASRIEEFIREYMQILIRYKCLKGPNVSNKGQCIITIEEDTPWIFDANSEYVLMTVEEGSTSVEFKSGKRYELNQGDNIVFPDAPYYRYRFIHRTKATIRKYPINFDDVNRRNHFWNLVHVITDKPTTDLKNVITEVNHRYFNFHIFGNVFKFDGVIDSCSKLWLMTILDGSVRVGDTVYNKKDSILIFPIYLGFEIIGKVEQVLVQGPPFR